MWLSGKPWIMMERTIAAYYRRLEKLLEANG
jgi:hypothetical protein